MQPSETFTVDTLNVACDGGTLGHPVVYLNLAPAGEVDCPYCGRHFVLAEGAQADSGH